MRYTLNFECKSYESKDGTLPILIRVYLNGEQDFINLGRRIKAKNYDTENKCIRAKTFGHSAYMNFIERQKVKIDSIIQDFEKRDEIATIAQIKEIYSQLSGNVKTNNFYDFVKQTIEYERKNTQKTCGHLDAHLGQLEKLKRYRKKLSIHEITPEFLAEYKSYLLNTLKQADNTAYHAMCFIRKYTKILFGDGKIKTYAFNKFIVGKPFEVEPEYLEPEEITALHDLYDSGDLLKIVRRSENKYCNSKEFHLGIKYQEVLRYFLASCYSGLRHSDIKTLRKQHVKGKYIVKEVVKGREGRHKTVRIPIRKRLLSLFDLTTSAGLVFESPVMETSQTNKYLLEVLKVAGINKHITFHCARHTFAITSLVLGIRIEVVSDILAHSELTTTQRYARIVDRLRDEEMNKWDKLAKEHTNDQETEVICPGCENTVLRFEPGVIALNKLPLVCPYCSNAFTYSLKPVVVELKKVS